MRSTLVCVPIAEQPKQFMLKVNFKKSFDLMPCQASVRLSNVNEVPLLEL